MQPGTYRTKILIDGKTTRATLEIEAGKACKFAYKVSAESTEWEKTTCE
jgi:hypothetical protein